MGRRGGRGNDDDAIGCLLIIVFAFLAMPIVGLYLIFRGNESDKAIGIILLTISVVILIYCGVH